MDGNLNSASETGSVDGDEKDAGKNDVHATIETSESQHERSLNRARQLFLEGMKELGLGDGTRGWVQHADQSGQLRRDSFTLDAEIFFGMIQIKEHLDAITSRIAKENDAYQSAGPLGKNEARSEVELLVPILRNLCSGGQAVPDADIYAASYQADDGDVYIRRAADLLEKLTK